MYIPKFFSRRRQHTKISTTTVVAKPRDDNNDTNTESDVHTMNIQELGMAAFQDASKITTQTAPRVEHETQLSKSALNN